MKHIATPFLSWFVLLTAFVFGGATHAYAQDDVYVGSQITDESGIVSGNNYLVYYVGSSHPGYMKDTGSAYTGQDDETPTTAAVYCFEGSTGAWTLRNLYTGKYWGTPTASQNVYIGSDSPGTWALNFQGNGNIAPSCNGYSWNRSSGNIHPWDLGTGGANQLRIYEVADPSQDPANMTPTFTANHIIEVGEAVSSFTPVNAADDNSHWYIVTQDRGGETPMYDYGVGNTVHRATTDVTAASLSGTRATDVPQYLVRFISTDTEGLYHIQFGNGTFITSTLTTAALASGAGSYAFYNSNGGSGSYFGWNLDSNTGSRVDNNGASHGVSFYGSGTIEATSGNNVWHLYPVSFPDLSQTVIYSYKYNGTEMAIEVVTPVTGDAFPAPTAVPFGFSASAPSGTVAAADMGTTIDVPLTWTLFDYAADFNSITQWYTVRLHSNQTNYLYNNSGALAFANSLGENAYLWGFVGDPVSGFTLYNHEGGSSVALDNANPCTLSADGTSAKFFVHSADAGTQGASADYYFALYANQGSYLNYQGAAIKRWSAYDEGSTFMINSATPVSDHITLTFTDGTNPVEVSVNGETASSTYTYHRGTPPTSIGSGANLSTYTLGGTEYHGRSILDGIAPLTADATITVTTPTGPITVTDINGNPLTAGTTYYIRDLGENKYMCASDDHNHITPEETPYADSYRFTVEGAGQNLIIKNVLANQYLAYSAFGNAEDLIAPTAATANEAMTVNAKPGSQANGWALNAADNYYVNFFAHHNLGFWSDSNSRPTAPSNTWQFIPIHQITFEDASGNPLPASVNGVTFDNGSGYCPVGQITSLRINGLPVGENTVATITSGGSSAQYTGADILTTLNTTGADATVTVATLTLSFVDLHDIPMIVTANGKDYNNGKILLINGQELGSLTPPIRLATYTIGSESGLNAQEVVEKVATLTADTKIECNAYYKLTFQDVNGNTINSQIRGGGVTLDYAASHDVGMHCIIDKALLYEHTKLNYTYVLQEEEYDILGFYAALAKLEVAQGAEVVVTVKENPDAITVTDIYGNAIVPGNNYYVVFPGRAAQENVDYFYFGTGGNGADNVALKLNTACSYAAPATNHLLFQVEGNGQYIRLKPSRTNMDGAYVASEDITNGPNKVEYCMHYDHALVFRAEKFLDYTNCYGLRVSNNNGALVTYLSNYGGVTENMGFYGSMDAGGFVQFVPYASGLTLNFVNTNGNAQQVVVYKNGDANGGTAQNSGNRVTTMTFSVANATDRTNLQDNRYFYVDRNGVAMNAVNYRYNNTDYSTWEEVLSSGAAAGGTVTVTLQATGIQPLDIYGSPVVAGRKYRILRLGNNNTLNYLKKTVSNNRNYIGYSTELLTDGTQYWTVTPADNNWSTVQLSQGGIAVKYSSGSTYVGGNNGSVVNLRCVLVDRTTHYYIMEYTSGNTTRRFYGPTNSGYYSFNTNNQTAETVKFAFVPAGGVVDAYDSELAADRTYRIEMPAKVGQTDFLAERPVTLTRTAVNSNSSVAPTNAIATSVEQYNTYYWLPDTYTGLDYMYNVLQAWNVEPVSGAEAAYLIKSEDGYLKVGSYAENAAVTVNAAQGEATTFYGEPAEYEGLTHIYGLYTVDPDAATPTKLYLCTPGANTEMKLASSPKQSDIRWNADYVFRFTPVKEQTLAAAYSGGHVLAKGFDCYGPGKTGKGLVWNSTTEVYEESSTDIITAHDMFRGLGDKHDSIVGYHLPDRVFLAYDYATSAYKETVDFAAPELIGYNGTISSTKTSDGYYEFTGYTLKNFPIVASPAPKLDDSGVYQFDPSTNWYMVVLRDCDRKELIDNNLQAVTALNSITNPFVDKFLFCFVGDEHNGYLIYNKARGASHFMGPLDEQARWDQANNVKWIENSSSMTDTKRNKSRIFFQTIQHDKSGHTSFVDRYTGFSLDRYEGYVVYWHGRPGKSGNGYADNASGDAIDTDYKKTQLGVIPNSFYRGGNLLEARTMGFPLVADLYSDLLQSSVESGYLASLVGYVGLFRSEQDIMDNYDVYRHRVAQANANIGLTDAEYKAELTNAYNAFFNWLKARNGGYAPLTNGVGFSNSRYYYLRSVATNEYLAVTSGTEGAANYSFTMTSDPESLPGAVWQFDANEYKTETYNSELGTTHRLRNVYWNADLKVMDTSEGDQTATLVLDDSNYASIDVFNDMNVMENPGQFVLRTESGGYLNETNSCLSLIDGELKAHAGRVGGGQRRWYLVPVMTESPSSNDTWADLDNRVEDFTTVTIPEGKNWVNGTTIGTDVASDLIFTTYCNPERAVAFPHNSNIYAFRAVEEVGEGSAIFLEELDDTLNNTIPAGMGVVMLAPNGKMIPFLPVASSGVTNTESLLVSAGDDLEKNTVAAGNYVFVYKKSGDNYILKFYKAGSKGVSLGYHRAYLPSNSLSSATRSLSSFSFDMFFEDGTVTKVTLPMTDTEDDEDFNGVGTGTYDMQGRRVDDPTQPGIYIINGRKVFVK